MSWINPRLKELWQVLAAFLLLGVGLTVVLGSTYRFGRDIFNNFVQDIPVNYSPYSHSSNIEYSIFTSGKTFDVRSLAEGDSPGTWKSKLVPPPKGSGYAVVALTVTNFSPSTSTLQAELAVALTPSFVQQLKLDLSDHLAALNPLKPQQWAGLPVKLTLTSCPTDESNPACLTTSSVDIPLGRLLNPVGDKILPELTSRSVDIYANADPSAYPQDTYAVYLYPLVTLPPGIIFTTGARPTHMSVPVRLSLMGGPGLLGKSVVVRTGRSPLYQVVISRRGLDQSLAYAMALIPAFLGFIIFCATLSIRKTESAIPSLIGFLVAWLTILPLRLVLVPQELGATPLTRIDDLLIIDAAIVFLFVTLTFVQIIIAVSYKNARKEIRKLDAAIASSEGRLQRAEELYGLMNAEELKGLINEEEAKQYAIIDAQVQVHERRFLKAARGYRCWLTGDNVSPQISDNVSPQVIRGTLERLRGLKRYLRDSITVQVVTRDVQERSRPDAPGTAQAAEETGPPPGRTTDAPDQPGTAQAAEETGPPPGSTTDAPDQPGTAQAATAEPEASN